MDKVTEKMELAESLFNSGYNCAQAVLCAFADELGMDMQTARSIASSFGGGMGRMREVCGACSGMFMAAGLRYGGYDPDDHEAKTAHYALIQQLAAEFKDKNGGSIICRELLGLGSRNDGMVPEKRTEEYYKKRPCGKIVAEAAGIFCRMMESKA